MAAFHVNVDERGHRDARARAILPAGTSEEMYDRMVAAVSEREAMMVELETRREEIEHVDMLKREISMLKESLQGARSESSRLEVSLMSQTNRSDEASLRKQYEEGEKKFVYLKKIFVLILQCSLIIFFVDFLFFLFTFSFFFKVRSHPL